MKIFPPLFVVLHYLCIPYKYVGVANRVYFNPFVVTAPVRLIARYKFAEIVVVVRAFSILRQFVPLVGRL